MSQREEILAVQGFIVLANVAPHPVGEVLESRGFFLKIEARATWEEFRRQVINFTGADPAEDCYREKREKYKFFHKAVLNAE